MFIIFLLIFDYWSGNVAKRRETLKYGTFGRKKFGFRAMSQRILKLCVASLLNILCFPEAAQIEAISGDSPNYYKLATSRRCRGTDDIDADDSFMQSFEMLKAMLWNAIHWDVLHCWALMLILTHLAESFLPWLVCKKPPSPDSNPPKPLLQSNALSAVEEL